MEQQQMNQHQVEVVRNIIDGTAIVVAGASFAGLIPSVAGLFTIVWTGMRVWEMIYGVPFSQSFIARWINRKK